MNSKSYILVYFDPCYATSQVHMHSPHRNFDLLSSHFP